jgi:DNA-binding phage protein
MSDLERKAMIKFYLDAYRETGNKRFLARALKLAEVEKCLK